MLTRAEYYRVVTSQSASYLIWQKFCRQCNADVGWAGDQDDQVQVQNADEFPARLFFRSLPDTPYNCPESESDVPNQVRQHNPSCPISQLSTRRGPEVRFGTAPMTSACGCCLSVGLRNGMGPWRAGRPRRRDRTIGVRERKQSLENGCFGCSLRSERASDRASAIVEEKQEKWGDSTAHLSPGLAGVAGRRGSRGKNERTRT